jgi:hypothetical protein
VNFYYVKASFVKHEFIDKETNTVKDTPSRRKALKELGDLEEEIRNKVSKKEKSSKNSKKRDQKLQSK